MLQRAKQLAQAVEVRAFSAIALKETIAVLQGCLRDTEDVRKAASLLKKAGVRLVIVEFLAGAKLDGACFWQIALSLRLDRIDNFWHTLFHEVDHVIHGVR